ncbi:MAG: hypothetical protein WDM90_17445 [Ferruginibacter sp.]
MMEERWDLEGMIEDVIMCCDYALDGDGNYKKPMTLGEVNDVRKIARQITNVRMGCGRRTTDNGQQKTDDRRQKKRFRCWG